MEYSITTDNIKVETPLVWGPRLRNRSVGEQTSNFTLVYDTQITLGSMRFTNEQNITGGPHIAGNVWINMDHNGISMG